MGLLNLARTVGHQRMEAAARRANRFGITSYQGLRRILDKGLESEPLDGDPAKAVSEHPNIRGRRYYTPADSARSAS